MSISSQVPDSTRELLEYPSADESLNADSLAASAVYDDSAELQHLTLTRPSLSHVPRRKRMSSVGLRISAEKISGQNDNLTSKVNSDESAQAAFDALISPDGNVELEFTDTSMDLPDLGIKRVGRRSMQSRDSGSPRESFGGLELDAAVGNLLIEARETIHEDEEEEEETPEWKKKLVERRSSSVGNKQKNLLSVESAPIELGSSANKWAQHWQSALQEKDQFERSQTIEKLERSAASVKQLSEDPERDAAIKETLKKMRKARKLMSQLDSQKREGKTESFTDIFLQQFIVDDEVEKTSIFQFCNQGFLLSNYKSGDPDRVLMSKMLARSITRLTNTRYPLSELNLADSALDDDFVIELTHAIFQSKDAAKNLEDVVLINLESNLLTERGILDLCKLISSEEKLPKLKYLRLENQKFAFSSAAEAALERSIGENKKILKLSLSFRNADIGRRVSNSLSKNGDLVRQERLRASKESGEYKQIIQTDLQRKIQNIIVENDPSIVDFTCLADRFFLSLKNEEKLQFASGLADAKYLKTLKLNNCDLGNDFAIELGKALAKNISLETVDLDNNKIQSEGIQALCESLQENTTLKVLKILDQVGLSTGVSSSCEIAICNAMEKNKSLTKLGLKFRNNQTRERVEKLLRRNQDADRRARRASSLSPPPASGASSPISPQQSLPSSREISPASRSVSPFKKKTDLQIKMEKIMSGQPLEGKGEDMFETVDSRVFDGIKDQVKLDFFKSLKSNTTLRILTIVRQNLTDAHAFELADSLSTNSCIEEVNLEGNKFTAKGLEALCLCLASNKKIKKLLLKHQINQSQIPTQSELKIVQAIEGNETIVNLGVGIKTTNAQDKIEKILRKNKRR